MGQMNDRVRAVIKATNLTQIQFAKKINVSQQYVSQLTKVGEPSDRTIADICREFNVNEHWFRTGEGEMFNETTQDERIAEFVGSALSGRGKDIQRRMLAALSKLRDEDWDAVDYFVQALLEESEARKQTETEQDPGGR